MQVCLHVEARRWCPVSPLSPSPAHHLIFLRQGLSLNPKLTDALNCLASEPLGASIFMPRPLPWELGYTATSSFWHVFSWLNSCPPACVASVLPTEPSPRPPPNLFLLERPAVNHVENTPLSFKYYFPRLSWRQILPFGWFLFLVQGFGCIFLVRTSLWVKGEACGFLFSLLSRPGFLKHNINFSEPVFPAEKQGKAKCPMFLVDRMVCLYGEDKLHFMLETLTLLFCSDQTITGP